MIKYTESLNQSHEAFTQLVIQHISQTKNGKEDELTKMASSSVQLNSSKIVGQELVSQINHANEVMMEKKGRILEI